MNSLPKAYLVLYSSMNKTTDQIVDLTIFFQ